MHHARLQCSPLPPRQVTCHVPAGYGRNNLVRLYRAGRSSYTGNLTALLYVNYNPPNITDVRPTKVPTTGGLVTLTGVNFGPNKNRTTVRDGTKTTIKRYERRSEDMRAVVSRRPRLERRRRW
jgi:hypothetical protein